MATSLILVYRSNACWKTRRLALILCGIGHIASVGATFSLSAVLFANLKHRLRSNLPIRVATSVEVSFKTCNYPKSTQKHVLDCSMYAGLQFGSIRQHHISPHVPTVHGGLDNLHHRRRLRHGTCCQNRYFKRTATHTIIKFFASAHSHHCPQ